MITIPPTRKIIEEHALLTRDELLNKFGLMDKIRNIKETFINGVEKMTNQYEFDTLTKSQQIKNIIDTAKQTKTYIEDTEENEEEQEKINEQLQIEINEEKIKDILDDNKYDEELTENRIITEEITLAQETARKTIEKTQEEKTKHEEELAKINKENEAINKEINRLNTELDKQNKEINNLKEINAFVSSSSQFTVNASGNNLDAAEKAISESMNKINSFKNGLDTKSNGAFYTERNNVKQISQEQQEILNKLKNRKNKIAEYDKLVSDANNTINKINEALKFRGEAEAVENYWNQDYDFWDSFTRLFTKDKDDKNNRDREKRLLKNHVSSMKAAIRAFIDYIFMLNNNYEFGKHMTDSWDLKNTNGYKGLINMLGFDDREFQYYGFNEVILGNPMTWHPDGYMQNNGASIHKKSIPSYIQIIDAPENPKASSFLDSAEQVLKMLDKLTEWKNKLQIFIKDTNNAKTAFINSLGTQVNKYKDNIARIDNIIKNVAAGSKNEIESLRREIEILIGQRDTQINIITTRAATIDALTSAVIVCQQKVDMLTEELAENKVKLNNLSKKFNEINEKKAILRDEMKILDYEISQHKRNYERILQNVALCKQTISDLSDELQTLYKDLENAMNEEAAERIRKLIAEKEAEKQRQLNALEEHLKGLSMEKKAIEEKQKILNKKAAEYLELENERKIIINEINDTIAYMDDLTSQIYQYTDYINEYIEDIKREQEQMKKDLKELEELIKKTNETITRYKEAIEENKQKKGIIYGVGISGIIIFVIALIGLIISAHSVYRMDNPKDDQLNEPLLITNEYIDEETNKRRLLVFALIVSVIGVLGGAGMSVYAGLMAKKYLILSNDVKKMLEETDKFREELEYEKRLNESIFTQ